MTAVGMLSSDGPKSEEPVHVPTLRQDLKLLPSWATRNGEPTWTIFDPIRNQYFRIGRSFFVFLSFWKLSNLVDIQKAAEKRLNREVDSEELSSLVKFLLTNQLTDVSPESGYRGFYERSIAGKKGIFSTVLHGYLFFKIPLFRPDRFLAWTWPWIRFFFTKAMIFVLLLVGVAGLYLVSRQWPAFKDNFISMLSIEGVVFYGLSLVFVKICHELGHAYMAHKYGLKVNVIGVAFLVLMPIMYTDTSNAWRLTEKRKRLMVDGAGIMVELGLACFATMLWVFVPDGILRSILFSIAAVSWTLSLLINLNPFMRFDGYFILSDFLEVENLQARGFALARWRLRELLFGLEYFPPENLPPALQRSLIFHAWGTWIYRFFLFLGIALLVYTFFIKVVAIFLFVVEILWFICLPIYREIKEWWKMKEQIAKSRRSLVSLLLFSVLVMGAVLPLSKTVSVVGVVHSAEEMNVYAPFPAKLVKLHVHNNQVVEKGDVLAEFQSEELELKIQLLKKKQDLLRKRIDRSVRDAIDGNNRLVLESELAGQVEELDSLLLQRDELTLNASISGEIVDLRNTVHVGRYIDQSAPLFRLRSPQDVQVTGLVNESHVDRLKQGAKGTFYPDDAALNAMPIQLSKINKSSTKSLSFPEMSINFGGVVSTQPATTDSNTVTVDGSYYGVEFSSASGSGQLHGQTQRGIVHIEAVPQSFASRVFKQIGSILVRETGF